MNQEFLLKMLASDNHYLIIKTKEEVLKFKNTSYEFNLDLP
jgi:hypothetical protein